MITWVRRARLRPAFSASRLILLILFGCGGSVGYSALLLL
jgi:hypothetical protein